MKTAVITGASRGLGRALTLALVDSGAHVVGIARPSPQLDRLAREAGTLFTAVAADVSDPDAMVRAAARAHDAVGDVDLLVHNASTLGPVPLRPAVDISSEQLAHVLAVNVAGPHALTRRVAGAMALRGEGTVVAISSDAAVHSYADWGPYSASKAANDHLFRVLAAENPELRFVTVDPGEMDTAMHAAALPGADPDTLRKPEHVARAVLALLDRAETGTRYELEVTS